MRPKAERGGCAAAKGRKRRRRRRRRRPAQPASKRICGADGLLLQQQQQESAAVAASKPPLLSCLAFLVLSLSRRTSSSLTLQPHAWLSWCASACADIIRSCAVHISTVCLSHRRRWCGLGGGGECHEGVQDGHYGQRHPAIVFYLDFVILKLYTK